MAVKAFVLIETEVGKTAEIVTGLLKVKGVKSADSVAGPCDIVATIEVADLDALGGLVKRLRSISGIYKTTTLIGMKF